MTNKVKQINDSLKNGKVIIAFMMVGCHWCDKLKPIWNSVKSKYPENLFDITVSQDDPNVLDKLNCDTSNTTNGFPSICAYNNGKKIECFKGNRTQEAINKFVKKHLGQTGGGKRRYKKLSKTRKKRKKTKRNQTKRKRKRRKSSRARSRFYKKLSKRIKRKKKR